MLFILQQTKDFDIELTILKNELKRQKYLHGFREEEISYFDEGMSYPSGTRIKECVPVGSIEFVEKCLKNVHGIGHMVPMEIPEVLRKDEFLLRDYKIVDASHIPESGMWFIKDASRLKQFSYCGEMSYFMYEDIFNEPKINDTRLHLNPAHKFVISGVIPIMAEYRVFVMDDEIQGIQFYDGIPTIMPTPDEIKKLKKICNSYMLDDTRPKSYAIDIAIIKADNKEKRDLAIIEVCPFMSLGLYGFYSEKIPYMYADGFRWYLENNNED